MGREGRRFARQEAKEEQGRPGGTRARPQQPWGCDQVRDDTAVAGRSSAGVASQGSASCYLLPRVALARPPESSRTEGARCVRLPVLDKAEGGLHQPVPLQARRKSRCVMGNFGIKFVRSL